MMLKFQLDRVHLPYDRVRSFCSVIRRSLGRQTNDVIPECARRELSSSSVEAKGQGNDSIVTLGRNILSIISLLWPVGRLPERKISHSIESLYHLKLSAATIGHALQKVSDRLAAFYEKVRMGISRSNKANFDETTLPVAGKKRGIWIAAPKKCAYVQVVMSRGRNVLEMYFPKFRGVAIVDGLKIYKQLFKVIQRVY